MIGKTLENSSVQEKRGAAPGVPTYNSGPWEAGEELHLSEVSLGNTMNLR